MAQIPLDIYTVVQACLLFRHFSLPRVQPSSPSCDIERAAPVHHCSVDRVQSPKIYTGETHRIRAVEKR